MKKHFFRTKFLMFITLTLVPICIFGFILVFSINMRVKKEAAAKTSSTASLIEQYIGELTNTLEFYRVTANSDARLHLALVSLLGNSSLRNDSLERMEQSMQSIYYSLSSKPYIQSLYITIDKSPYFINGITRERFEDATDKTWMEDLNLISPSPLHSSPDKNMLIVRNIKRNKFDTTTIPVVTVYQSMKYNEIMAISIKQDYFNRWLDSITAYKGQTLLLLDQQNNILFFNKNKDLINPDLLVQVTQPGTLVSDSMELDGYFINKKLFPGSYGFSYLSLIPKSEVYRLPNSILALTLAAALISILLSSLLAYLFTVRDYRQLSQIIVLFEDAEKGQFKPREYTGAHLKPADVVTNNAYFHIINNVINLFMSQTYLNLQLDAKKYALAAAQLSALQYQLNPHFLFNTLQSIDLEILKIGRRPTPANHMISELSQLLRYSLDDPMKYVSIQEEITMTKNYVDLQTHKYGSYFSVSWEYPSNILSLPTLRLLMQPLIENAITHAGTVEPEKLWVKIKINEKKEKLRFTIIDNGHGMSRERLHEIRNNIIDEAVDTSGKHIGLANISQRVRLAYEDGEMKIYSKAGWGTIVQYSFSYNKRRFTEQ